MNEFNGYSLADKVLAPLNDAYEQYPPNKDNLIQWLNCLRTVKSSIDLMTLYIDRTLQDTLKAKDTDGVK